MVLGWFYRELALVFNEQHLIKLRDLFTFSFISDLSRSIRRLLVLLLLYIYFG